MQTADDRPSPPASQFTTFMKFDWATGQALGYYGTLWNLSEHDREIDSHHYTNPIIWHSDGRVYLRRGGDNGSTQVFVPWTLEFIRIFNRDAQGIVRPNGIDATALMQVYKDMLICRYGHTLQTTQPFYAGSIAEPCYVDPNEGPDAAHPDVLGKLRATVGPTVPLTPGADGIYADYSRYGDYPKCANDVCVMAARVSSPTGYRVWLEATDLAGYQTLWTGHWSSDSGGAQGFYTSISDYWRFIATESGHYIFFTRGSGQPVTVRAVDLRTGEEKWFKPMPNSQERPLLAYHAGCVYVIGRADQYKLNVADGTEVWHTTHSFPYDRGYILGNHEDSSTFAVTQDPLYRPAVLTNDTLWFVDGDTPNTSLPPSAATLVGLRTADGQIIKQIDLRSFYVNTPRETVQVVNDLLIADGKLGVLVGVKRSDSAYPNSNGMDYQDLYVFAVRRAGDFNNDGKVNIFDLQRMASTWNKQQGEPGYDATCDLTGDGKVDVMDLQILANSWNR